MRKRSTEGLVDVCHDHQAIVTTLDSASEDIYHFYNHRCTAETMIQEAKAGFGIDAITRASADANRADLALKILAYNLALAFQRDLGPRGPGPHRLIGPVRRTLLQIPAVLVHHVRGWTLRLAAGYARWDHLRWRQRLDRLVPAR